MVIDLLGKTAARSMAEEAKRLRLPWKERLQHDNWLVPKGAKVDLTGLGDFLENQKRRKMKNVMSIQESIDHQGSQELQNIRKFEGSQKRRNMTIPEVVIIYEILSRVAVKSLMRFKCVCKSWNAIICGNDPKFITSHLQQSRKQLHVLVMPGHRYGSGIVSCHFREEKSSTSYQSEIVLDKPDLEGVAPTSVPSHSDGLLLYSSATQLNVCNLATREFVTLPSSTNVNKLNPYNAAVIGHDPLSNKYKVVRLFYRFSNLEARNCSLGLEVLTLGSQKLCWTPTLEDPPYPIWPGRTASTVNGVIYWLIDNTLHRSSPQAIISFDLKNGKYGVVDPPPTWQKTLDNFHMEACISDLNGDLCCMKRCRPLLHIYLYRDGKWHVICSERLDLDERLYGSSVNFGTFSHGKIMHCVSEDKSFIYYDPQKHTTILIEEKSAIWPRFPEDLRMFSSTPYIESMLPIRQKK